MATVDVKLDDKVELTLPANENDYIYILRQVAGGGFGITDYKIKVRNLVGNALPFSSDGLVPAPEAGTMYFNTSDSQMRGYDGTAWNNIYNNVHTVSKTLTASEIKNIGTTPIQILPAQGANKIINVISALAITDNVGTVGYDDNFLSLISDSVGADFQYSTPDFLSIFGGDIVQSFYINTGASTDVYFKNKALLVGGVDSVATGDVTYTIQVTYQIVSV